MTNNLVHKHSKAKASTHRDKKNDYTRRGSKMPLVDDVVDYQKMVTKDCPKDERRKLNIGDIWSNALRCKLCNTVIRSRNRHDMVTCDCGNATVDGGSWYQKCSASGGLGTIECLIEMFEDVSDE